MTPVHHQNHATWECNIMWFFIPEISQKGAFPDHEEALG